MNFLIIEDDKNKYDNIHRVLHTKFPDSKIILKGSYNSGVKEILTNEYNFIILDMSLPLYENEIGKNNYEIKPFAGIDILNQMKRYKKNISTVIVTQFEVFTISKTIREEISITELKNNLENLNYLNYKGLVYYDATSSYWEKELLEIIN